MDLADLRVLLQVVEYGSFQGAAQGLRVSRSALRRQVERLESELDVELLSRGARGIELTAAGRELTDGAAQLLRDASNLADRTRSFGAGARGTLRIIVPLGVPAKARAAALMNLRRMHGELAVDVREADDPIALLAEPFDLMLHFGPAPDREGWFSHVVARAEVGLFASSAYLAAHGTPGSLAELDAHPLLVWTCPALPVQSLPLREGGQHPRPAWLRTANLALLVELAERGAGVVLVPQMSEIFGEAHELVPVLPELVGTSLELRALSPRPSRVDPKIRAMLENIQGLLARLSPN